MKVHEASGLAFPDLDDFMVRECEDDGGYQRTHLEAALRYVTAFTCAIDGGAHVGTWSLLLARQFARVIAIEPSADTFECLQRNLALRGCGNVEARQIALGAAVGVAGMALDPANAARKNTGARRLANGTSVRVETIDSWQLETVGFLKLDIEGSEPFALEGAVETLKRCRPIVLFENKRLWSRYYGRPKDAVERILTACRYRHCATVVHDAIWSPA